MNRFCKLLLTCSSICPVFVAFAVQQWSNNKTLAFIFVLMMLILAFICYVLISQRKHLELKTIKCLNINQADGEPLSFLVIYLLPFLTSGNQLTNNFTMIGYVLVIFMLCIYQSNAYIFNPLLLYLIHCFLFLDIIFIA